MTPRKLKDFEGGWQITRQIDQVAGPDAQFEGEALWAPDPAGLIYTENGWLTVARQPQMRAERSYRWDVDLCVHFLDGQFFHQVPPLGGDTSHWCDPDQYDVSYDFTTWPDFQVTWTVNGPAKSYRSTTQYSPQAAL